MIIPMNRRTWLAAAGAALAGCSSSSSPDKGPAKGSLERMTKQPFGKMADGTAVDLYTLKNKNGIQADITPYGATVVRLLTPDKNGKLGDVALGFDTLDGYLQDEPYFGAVVGRYGNRIAKGRFKIGAQEYKLAVNNGENSLHGGIKGFDKHVWQAKDVSAGDKAALELSMVSPDGDEGYPGKLEVKVTYTLTDNGELYLDYRATPDKDTVVNLTNHTYFNLAGQGEGDILGHEIQLFAEKFTPVDKGLIPTGELRPVEGTPFDFRKAMLIGARINADDEQIRLGGGYDHNYVVDGQPGVMRRAARVHDPKTGRVLEVMTVEPGVQFYTGNFLDGKLTGKGGKVYPKRSGLCLETQHFPDSPNQPKFPTTLVKAGAVYQTSTIWRFSTE